MLDSRAQLMPCSRVVTRKLSSKRPSSQPISSLLSWCRFSTGIFWPVGNRPHGLFAAHQFASLHAHRQLFNRTGSLLGRRAAHPVDVTPPPEIGEAYHKHAKKH